MAIPTDATSHFAVNGVDPITVDQSADSGRTALHAPDGKPIPSAFQQEVDRLRSLALQMETFLTRQINRIEAECSSAQSVDSPELTEEQGWENLRKERAKWEEELRQECGRLQEDSQRLLEGWSKLEREQRELLKQRLPGKSGAVSVDPTVSHGGGASTPVVPTTSAVAGANPGGPAQSNPNAVRTQFQQIRREMLDHARQRRKG